MLRMMVRVPRDRRHPSDRPCGRDGCSNVLPESAAVQARYCSLRCQVRAYRDRKAKG